MELNQFELLINYMCAKGIKFEKKCSSEPSYVEEYTFWIKTPSFTSFPFTVKGRFTEDLILETYKYAFNFDGEQYLTYCKTMGIEETCEDEFVDDIVYLEEIFDEIVNFIPRYINHSNEDVQAYIHYLKEYYEEHDYFTGWTSDIESFLIYDTERLEEIREKICY